MDATIRFFERDTILKTFSKSFEGYESLFFVDDEYQQTFLLGYRRKHLRMLCVLVQLANEYELYLTTNYSQRGARARTSQSKEFSDDSLWVCLYLVFEA